MTLVEVDVWNVPLQLIKWQSIECFFCGEYKSRCGSQKPNRIQIRCQKWAERFGVFDANARRVHNSIFFYQEKANCDDFMIITLLEQRINGVREWMAAISFNIHIRAVFFSSSLGGISWLILFKRRDSHWYDAMKYARHIPKRNKKHKMHVKKKSNKQQKP